MCTIFVPREVIESMKADGWHLEDWEDSNYNWLTFSKYTVKNRIQKMRLCNRLLDGKPCTVKLQRTTPSELQSHIKSYHSTKVKLNLFQKIYLLTTVS